MWVWLRVGSVGLLWIFVDVWDLQDLWFRFGVSLELFWEGSGGNGISIAGSGSIGVGSRSAE